MSENSSQDSWVGVIFSISIILLGITAGVMAIHEVCKVPQLERDITDMKAQMLLHGWATYVPEGSKFQWVEKP